MADKSQQTEKASPRRLEKARKEGRYPSARDFVSAIQFAAFVTVLGSCGTGWLERTRIATRVLLDRAFHADLTVTGVMAIFWWIASQNLVPVIALGAILLAATFSAQMLVTGLGFSLTKLAPDLKRLSPAAKLRELPRQNLPALLQAAALLPLAGFAVYYIARQNAAAFMMLPLQGVEQGMRLVGSSVHSLLVKAAATFVVFGLVNLFRQRRQYTNDLKMSKQDLKDEAKESDGNPQMKQRVRRLQRDMRRRHMMKEVPTATAVIVNPTHFAVAIRYSMDGSAAPSVVAKGKNYLALRIRQKAVENQVPIIENPPLAQALYKSVDVGQEIPAHLYRAVAEVLAYIYRLMNGRMPDNSR